MFQDQDDSDDDYHHGEAGHVPEYIKALPTESRIVDETSNFDTQDLQDHTFNGVYFNVKCGDEIPIVYTRLDSIWVRGSLGPMKVFLTRDPVDFEGVFNKSSQWELVYDKFHQPNMYDRYGPSAGEESKYTELRLDVKRQVNPGQTYGVYVHSGREDDDGIVYDNSRNGRRVHDNGMLSVRPGAYAHLNSEPFNMNSPWGGYGRGFRTNREFVGRISFGVKWVLWTPEQHNKFPKQYRDVVKTLMMTWSRLETALSWLPQEMIFFILNMLWYGAFGKEEKEEEESDEEDQVEECASRFAQRFRGVHNFEQFQYFFGVHDGGNDDNDSDDDDDDSDDPMDGIDSYAQTEDPNDDDNEADENNNQEESGAKDMSQSQDVDDKCPCVGQEVPDSD